MTVGRTSSLGAQRVALALCAALAAIGVAVGGMLTIVKFRMTYTPCLAVADGCKVGELRCEDALASGWSVIGNLPISAWASAVYLCVLVLAIGLLVRRNFLGGCAVALLWSLSIGAAAISAAYAIYAWLVLQAPCPYCLSLYVVALAQLGLVAFVGRAFDPREQLGLWIALRHRRAALIDAVFRAAMLLTIVTGVQSMAYHGMRHAVTLQDGCPEASEPAPTATIRAGAATPQVILAVYLDMSCPSCKRKFKQLATALRSKQFPAPVELWIYHAPRHACDPAAFPAGFALSDAGAREDNACLAALAAECMERLQPGGGFRLIGGLFALHDDRRAGEPLFTPERIGNRAVELGLEIDPDDRDNALVRCIDDDRAVMARITTHQRHAEALQLTVPAMAVHAAVNGAIDDTRPPFWIVGNTPLEDLLRYVEIQAAAPTAPSE